MDNNPDNNFNRNFFAIVGGIFFSVLGGFLVKLILEKVFHVDPFTVSIENMNTNNLRVDVALGIWLLIPSMIGGLTCATISGRNDVSHVIISSLVVLALYFFISGGGVLKKQSLASWAILLVIPFGYFIGEWMGTARRK